MAMRHPKSIVLSGALSALFIMTVSATVINFARLVFLLCCLIMGCFFHSICYGMVSASTKHLFWVLFLFMSMLSGLKYCTCQLGTFYWARPDCPKLDF